MEQALEGKDKGAGAEAGEEEEEEEEEGAGVGAEEAARAGGPCTYFRRRSGAGTRPPIPILFSSAARLGTEVDW